MPLRAAAIVPAVCVPCPLSSIQAEGDVGVPADARNALDKVDVPAEVRMCEVISRVDVADRHRARTARDRLGIESANLAHVPLWAREGSPVAGVTAGMPSEPLASGSTSLNLVAPILVGATASTRESASTLDVKPECADRQIPLAQPPPVSAWRPPRRAKAGALVNRGRARSAPRCSLRR